jgi:hypothetical protein
MISPRKGRRLARLVFAVTSTAALLWVETAFASQAPGGGPGTASSLTQLAMAIIVYGTSALIVGRWTDRRGTQALKNQPRRQ